MKKTLTLLFILLLIPSLSATTLLQGKSTDFEGREITAKFIQQSKVVMQVDNEKTIINNDQTKVLNGVRITIVDILYTGGSDSTVSFNAELTYECGDSICNAGETPQNCCQDCECPINEKCTSSGCLKPECLLDEDCNDNKDLTKDTCDEYKCKYQNIRCTSNSQCDDNDPDTDDTCKNGRCTNLQNWVCKTDSDCEDPDPCTLDQCINKDCQYKKIENCTPKEEIKDKKTETSPPKDEEVIAFTQNNESGFFKRFFTWLKNLF